MLGLVAHEAHEAGGNSQSMMDKCWTQASGGLTKKARRGTGKRYVGGKTPEWCRITVL